MSNHSRQWRRQLALLVLLAVTTALPLNYFGQSLWRDEASSVWFAKMPLSMLLRELCDPHPPGYYLLLKAWLVAGEQEFWLRLPSLFAAVLAVALCYRLAREAGGRRVAWLAALLLALHPLQSWYSSETRAYMLAQSLGILLVWLGWRLIQTRRQGWLWWREALIYGLVGIVTLGIDYVALQPLGLLQLLWLARGRPHPRRWLSLQAIVLAGTTWLWLNPSQLTALSQSYHAVFIAVQATRAGIHISPTEAALLIRLGLAGVVLISGGLAWYWPTHLAGRVRASLLLIVIGSAWIGLLLLTGAPRAFTIKRQLVTLLPFLALLVAYGLARLSRPGGELAAGLGLLIILLFLPAHQREPWRTVVASLSQSESRQTSLVWVDELAAPVFDYYLGRDTTGTSSIRWTPLIRRELPQLPNLRPQIDELLWIVTVDSHYYNLMALLPLEFHRRYRLVEVYHQPGIDLYQYARQSGLSQGQVEIRAPISETLLTNNIAHWGLLLPSPLDTCQINTH